MKSLKIKGVLSIVLLIDFLITFGFGLVSWFSPYDTFGTIVDIPTDNAPLVLAMLSNISIFYILIALVCLVGIRAAHPTNIWIGTIMLIRHFWIGTLGWLDMDKDWLIGNPYPDIIIHSLFVLFYGVGIFYSVRKQ